MEKTTAHMCKNAFGGTDKEVGKAEKTSCPHLSKIHSRKVGGTSVGKDPKGREL